MNVHSVSIKGRRDQNEDKHKIVLNISGKNKKIKNINLLGVFDGHGGKEISKYLQENITTQFLNRQVQYPLKKKTVIDICDGIQKELKNYKHSYDSGTTCLLAMNYKSPSGDHLNIINVGDSRCILCRDNFAMPLTKDHKPHWPEERRRIEKIGGTIKFDGYDWRINNLSVSRAFGDIDSTPFVTHRPDLFRYKLDKNDKFIVLACDGLWDVLDNQEVVNFVLSGCYDSNLKKKVNNNINIAKKLAEYALKKGSSDNITVLVMFFQ